MDPETRSRTVSGASASPRTSLTQEFVYDGFDVNDSCVEKRDSGSADIAKEQWQFRARKHQSLDAIFGFHPLRFV
jgi:hypothetical protein